MSEHWYTKDGKPAYTVMGKNGRERDTTISDARNLNLVPSVTTILKCADKPGLTNWIIGQHILAALTCPRIEGEGEAAYLARIKKDAREQARKAAERGTQIHGWIEDGFSGDMHPDGVPYFQSALCAIEDECGDCDWTVEKTFASDLYGGRVDLHNDDYLLDVKTTDKDIATLTTWDDHHMQAAAYDHGIGDPGRQCGIIYVNSISADARIVWITEDEIQRGWSMFRHLMAYFYDLKKLRG